MKRILVTGGSGFCGRHLLPFLVRRGYQVFATSQIIDKIQRQPGIQFFRLDITEPSQVYTVISRIKPDFLCHLAAQSIPSVSWREPKETFETNIKGTLNVLNGLRKYCPQARLLYVSSIQVYGKTFKQKGAVKETDLLWPENPYAVSKNIAELACGDAYRRFGMDIVIARPVNFLGAGQPPHFVFSDWCRQVVWAEKRQRPSVLKIGNVQVQRDFLHVIDGVRAFEVLLRKGKSGESYNVGSGRIRSLKDYLKFLMRRSSVPLKSRVNKSLFRKDELVVTKLNGRKLRRLGWKPIYSTFDALEDLLREWRSKLKVRSRV